MKLQINTSGAWRNVVEFQVADTQRVCRAAESLAAILGPDTAWSYVSDFGDRYYYRHGDQGKPWKSLAQERAE